jgi:two-component sensor histidine kinase
MIVIGRFRSLNNRFRSLHPEVGRRLTRPTQLGEPFAELISNSYRHAFPNGEGKISISLQQSSPPDEATITFRDDGISLAHNRDGNRNGLGLVDRLMEQIRAAAQVRSDNGTAWTLRFPLGREGQRISANVRLSSFRR